MIEWGGSIIHIVSVPLLIDLNTAVPLIFIVESVDSYRFVLWPTVITRT